MLQIIEARFGDGLRTARDPRASGPLPDAEGLRRAYLDLLKLCLCDLGGTSTQSVARTIQGDVMSRELVGDQLRFRAAGLDWPLQGLTMVGLARLDDLQRCVESISRDGVDGDLVEAGSWRGGASILMRATLDSLGEDERTLWVADSFQGFPDVDQNGREGYDLSVDLAGCDFLSVPLEEVKASFARFGLQRGVNFVPGFFEDTLPTLTWRRWSIIRLDGDTYDATRLALDTLYPGLGVGGYLIVDDYFPLDECRRAVDDFRREHGIAEPIEKVDWSCARWRRQTESSPDPSADHADVAVGKPNATRPVARGPRARVPAIEEVELRHELSEVRGRLAAAEAEVDRLLGSPLYGPRAWLRRRLGRARRSEA